MSNVSRTPAVWAKRNKIRRLLLSIWEEIGSLEVSLGTMVRPFSKENGAGGWWRKDGCCIPVGSRTQSDKLILHNGCGGAHLCYQLLQG